MVQWTAKPAPCETVAPIHNVDAVEPATPPARKQNPRRRGRTPLALMLLLIAVGAMVPAGYLFLAHRAPAPEPGRHDQVEREMTTGRIIISDRTGCRERGFNNYNGQATEKGTVSCSVIAPKAQGLPERLDTIRRAFAPQ